MAKENAQQQGIQSVEVGMRVLEAIEELGGPASLSSIASAAGLTPSNTHRYLVSLVRVRLVTQDSGNGFYNLGPAARRLGLEAIRRTDDMSVAAPYTALIRDRTGHTVNTSVWADSGPTIVRWDYGRYPLPIIARVGSTLPLVDSSVGRIFLAYLPELVTRSVLRSQEEFHESSALTPEARQVLIDDVRRDGFATTTGGIVPGTIALAVPVLGPEGMLALVVGAVVPARVSSSQVLAKVEAELRRAGERLSADLGGSRPQPD